MESESRFWYCPRCDRRYASPEEMQEHLEKHEDFDAEMFGEKPLEEDND